MATLTNIDILKEIRWRTADVAPSDINTQILYCTINGKLGVFKDTSTPDSKSEWKRLAEKYRVKYWTYSNEITPQEQDLC